MTEEELARAIYGLCCKDRIANGGWVAGPESGLGPRGLRDVPIHTSLDLIALARAVLYLADAALAALEEPTEGMIAAANALPITRHVNSIIGLSEMRTGAGLPTDAAGNNTPLHQWWRAMIAAAKEG